MVASRRISQLPESVGGVINLGHNAALSIPNRPAVTTQASVDMDVVSGDDRVHEAQRTARNRVNYIFLLVGTESDLPLHASEEEQNIVGAVLSVRVAQLPHNENPKTEEEEIDKEAQVVRVKPRNPDLDNQRTANGSDRNEALFKSDVVIWRRSMPYHRKVRQGESTKIGRIHHNDQRDENDEGWQKLDPSWDIGDMNRSIVGGDEVVDELVWVAALRPMGSTIAGVLATRGWRRLLDYV